MGSFVVVAVHPLFGNFPHVVQGPENVGIQNGPSIRSVESLTRPFRVRHPGCVYRILISFPSHWFWNSSEMYSGPLSQRMLFGFPFSQMISSMKRINRDAGMECATFWATTTLKARNLRPLCKTSITKSIDQVAFARSGVTSGFLTRAGRHLREGFLPNAERLYRTIQWPA